MKRFFSQQVKKVIALSKEEANRLGHDFLGTEHLLLGLIAIEDRNLGIRVLESLDVSSKDLKSAIEQYIEPKKSISDKYNLGNLPLNKHVERVLKITMLEAQAQNSSEVHSEHLVLSILRHSENTASRILFEFDIDYDIYKAEMEYVKQEIKGELPPDSPDEPFEEESGARYSKKTGSKSKTPVLDNFGRNSNWRTWGWKNSGCGRACTSHRST